MAMVQKKNVEDLNVAGELITNICGALEVHANVANGMAERDALNSFAQKVLGSIDKQYLVKMRHYPVKCVS